MQAARNASAPNRQAVSARRNQRAAAQRVPRPAETYETIFRNALRAGFIAGLCVGLVAFLLLTWLWAVPTVESAYATAQAASTRVLA